jgi:hypothetical protein
MSDALAGLTRRMNDMAYDRETGPEIAQIVAEAQEAGGEASDALVELALYAGEDCTDAECDEMDAIEDGEDSGGPGYEYLDPEESDGAEYVDGDVTADEELDVDSGLADIERDLETEVDTDEGIIEESATVVPFQFEINVV